jgi:predicted DNA-binding protein
MYCIVLCFKLLREAFLANTKVARTIYINSDQVEALKKLSDRTKVPQAVYVREALDMLLDKYSEQLKLEFKDSFKERAIQKDLGF